MGRSPFNVRKVQRVEAPGEPPLPIKPQSKRASLQAAGLILVTIAFTLLNSYLKHHGIHH